MHEMLRQIEIKAIQESLDAQVQHYVDLSMESMHRPAAAPPSPESSPVAYGETQESGFFGFVRSFFSSAEQNREEPVPCTHARPTQAAGLQAAGSSADASSDASSSSSSTSCGKRCRVQGSGSASSSKSSRGKSASRPCTLYPSRPEDTSERGPCTLYPSRPEDTSERGAAGKSRAIAEGTGYRVQGKSRAIAEEVARVFVRRQGTGARSALIRLRAEGRQRADQVTLTLGSLMEAVGEMGERMAAMHQAVE